MKKEIAKLTPEQEAIIYIAEILDSVPGNDYKVLQPVLDILGLEKDEKKRS
jgi:hypothetical protein